MEEHPEELALFALLRSLEAALVQESKTCAVLLPFIREINDLLAAGSYPAALPLIDELEEFMDLEFCKKPSYP